MNLRKLPLLALTIGLSLGSMFLTACSTTSTGIRGEGSPASNGTNDTRQVAPGIKGNVNRLGTGGG